ncbi:MAG: hypothetical protein A2Y14_03265 [Verrucomicrobia bacterium GWF2_51_19]|nr:MAG: hypothetical protein A2Y14_03265 [Verrucomicrobia bacterium GWF2_51_19]HCJ11515.1 hypothetical protein [Opitutae bacterium]
MIYIMKTIVKQTFLIGCILAGSFYSFAAPGEAQLALIERWAQSPRPLTVADVIRVIDLDFLYEECRDGLTDSDKMPVLFKEYQSANEEFCQAVGILSYDQFRQQTEIRGPYGHYLIRNQEVVKRIQDFVNDCNQYRTQLQQAPQED